MKFCMRNHTYIVLIPKIKAPQDLSHFRPISLLNMLYKIVSKIMANGLKVALPSIISESQSVFVWNCHISNSVLKAYDLIHALKSKRSSKEEYFALKLDMSKAYNRVEWPFLSAIMRKLAFSDKWINMMHHYVSFVSNSIFINGLLGEAFFPERVCNKEIPFRLIYLLFVLRDYPTYCKWQKIKIWHLKWGFVDLFKGNYGRLWKHFESFENLRESIKSKNKLWKILNAIQPKCQPGNEK